MKRLYYILFGLLSVITYGQVTVFTEVNTKEPKLNEPLVLTIVQEVAGEDLEQQTPLQLMDLSKFDVVGTASERNTYIDQRKGIRINQLVYQVYLQPKTLGKLKIGSALVTVNGKIYKSEPFDVIVKEGDKRAENTDYFSKDVFLNLDVDDKEVYENQPVVAVLRAYSKNFNNFRKVENIKVPKQNDARIKPISYKKQDIENTDGEYSSQVIATFVIFPEKSGNIEIQPVSALIKTPGVSKISSNKVKLNVKTLPKGSPENFKNAVGKFNITINSSAKENTAELGKPIDVAVKISGLGNLDENKLPKIIESADYTFFAPKIVSHLSTSKDGVKGSVVAKYLLIPKKEGSLKIETEGFAFFNPENNQYVDLGNAFLNLNVLNAKQIAANKTPLDLVDDYTKGVIETVKIPIDKEKNVKELSFNLKYILGNFGIIALGILFLFLLYKLRSKPKSEKEIKPITTITEEEEKIRKQLKPDFSSYFNYLKLAKESGNFAQFFKTYEELHADTELYVENKFNMNLKVFLEEYNSAQFNEEYRKLVYAISMEKYAPIHETENIDELYNNILSIYTEITK
jgi:hypothetical protein